MKFISLFAGIGGFDLGLERAGMNCVAQVEIDGFCQKVLAKHWPDVPRFGDIRDVGKHNLPAADLICGGFPCQDVSASGKKEGIARGTRSGLWFEYKRIICEIKPRWVIVENVENLLRQGMGIVLGDLAASGYDAQWDVLPAKEFGAPHTRERVFIIAHSNCQRRRNASQRFSEVRLLKCIPKTETWISELPTSAICGKNNGVPNRVDRLKSLGNAVVPQVAEFIGRAIMEVAKER